MKNKVIMSGQALPVSEFEYKGHKFVEMKLSIKRLSGTIDSIPVLCPKTLIPEILSIDTTLPDNTNRFPVYIEGEIRTRNVHVNNHGKLVIYVYATKLSIDPNDIPEEDLNKVELEGTICKLPVYRITPNKVHITDIFIAVNNTHRSYYIPCIAFNKVAKAINKLNIGDVITINSRFQSRSYNKKLDENVIEVRVAYEMSITSFEKANNIDSTDEFDFDDICIDID